jgi:hypothetical protein
MVIIRKNTDATQAYSTNTNNGYHQLANINNSDRLFYILYAGSSGLYIDNSDAELILTEFIKSVQGGSWIDFDIMEGSIAAGEADTIEYTINAKDLPEDFYSKNIYISSNDPVTSEVVIPVTLQYGSILVVNPLADVLRDEGFATWSTEFGNVFDDPQDDPLSYIVVSLDEEVITVAKTGTTLNVTEAGIGKTTITIRADDGDGHVAYDDFNFEVNALLEVANPVADLVMDEGFGTHTIDLTNVFYDADNDPFTITAQSGTTTVATVSVTNNILTITEVGIGTTLITIGADDGNGDTAFEEFNFEINALLKVANPIADISMDEGFGTHIINLATVFNDADNDPFTITAASGTTSVATVSVTDKTLTITEAGTGTTVVTLTASDGEGDEETETFNFTVIEGSGTINPVIPVAINVYPNPTEGFVYISLNATITGKVKLTLFDATGQMVYNKDYSNTSELGTLDLSKFDSGIYILSVQTSETEYKQKLILE